MEKEELFYNAKEKSVDTLRETQKLKIKKNPPNLIGIVIAIIQHWESISW